MTLIGLIIARIGYGQAIGPRLTDYISARTWVPQISILRPGRARTQTLTLPALNSHHDFHKRLRDGVRRGDITCSVRIWVRPHVRVGLGEIGALAAKRAFCPKDNLGRVQSSAAGSQTWILREVIRSGK